MIAMYVTNSHSQTFTQRKFFWATWRKIVQSDFHFKFVFKGSLRFITDKVMIKEKSSGLL